MFVFSRVISPIDGKSMESISSIKMFQKSEYKENGKIIRWTEVCIITCCKKKQQIDVSSTLDICFSVLCRSSSCRGGTIPEEE